MSINNNLRDQLQWLDKEGSKARYTGFTKYVIPENGKLGSASISHPKDNRFARFIRCHVAMICTSINVIY